MLTIVKGSHPPPFFPSALLPRHFPSLLARHFWRAAKKPASQTLSCLPSGNLTVRYWTWPIEIVDLPLKNGWISSSQTLSLPESKGNMLISHSEPLVYQRVKETPNPILGGFPGKIDPPAWLTTCYPLVMADIAMENHHFLMIKSTISMGHGFKFAKCNSLPGRVSVKIQFFLSCLGFHTTKMGSVIPNLHRTSPMKWWHCFSLHIFSG